MTSSSEPLTIWKSFRTKPDGAGVEASSAVGESAGTFVVAAVVVIVDGGMKEEAKLEQKNEMFSESAIEEGSLEQ